MSKGISEYKRYHIETEIAPNIAYHPHRFKVKIKRRKLAQLLLKELFLYRGRKNVVLSSPCVYGVFSGPVGGFLPREELCVGCLRCTAEYPEVAKIEKNPKQRLLGDSYFTADQYDTVVFEARTGRIPVKGAGYRGPFGGKGWDGMWTDMSEIVRPTRDGIHGREFISTAVDIGGAPPFLEFDRKKNVIESPNNISMPIPLLFDTLPSKINSSLLLSSIALAAKELQTFLVAKMKDILKYSLDVNSIIPLVDLDDVELLKKLPKNLAMIEMAKWDQTLFNEIKTSFPKALVSLRLDKESDIYEYYLKGVRIFHLVANYHGIGVENQFIMDFIQKTHKTLQKKKCREEVTLIGSGGITSSEHIPKAIICGLDVVAINTPLLAALQGQFLGECVDRETSRFQLPEKLTQKWCVQRIKNMVHAWRDQLLEILGAMGLRDVRRLRGEMGRALIQKEFEDDAFTGIKGYDRS